MTKGEGSVSKKYQWSDEVKYADYQVGWLHVLRDEVTDFNLTYRHLSRLDHEISKYEQGRGIEGVDYKERIKTRQELRLILAEKLRYVDTLLNEVDSLQSVSNAIVYEYLFNPDSTVKGISKDLGVSESSVNNVLARYNDELNKVSDSVVKKPLSRVREFVRSGLLDVLDRESGLKR